MTDFRVHFDWNGNRHIVTIAADTPDAAASIITKRYPGAIVSKTKRDKSASAGERRKNTETVMILATDVRSDPFAQQQWEMVGDSRVRPNHLNHEV